MHQRDGSVVVVCGKVVKDVAGSGLVIYVIIAVGDAPENSLIAAVTGDGEQALCVCAGGSSEIRIELIAGNLVEILGGIDDL